MLCIHDLTSTLDYQYFPLYLIRTVIEDDIVKENSYFIDSLNTDAKEDFNCTFLSL